jgi:hypothetical protein
MGPARLRGRDARRPPAGTRRTDHTASLMPAGAGSEPTEQITHSGAPQKSSNKRCIPKQNGGSVRFDQAGRQSRCVSRRHQAGESPIAGYERGDGWARIAADAACRRWHRRPLGCQPPPRGGQPARQGPHRSLVRTGSAGPPAASRGMLGAARMPEGRGHRRSPRPFLWPLARHARQGRCLHPGLAAASRGGRLRSGGLEVVTIGPLRSPIRVLEDLRERDPAPGPSQNHTISIPPPGPGAPRRPSSGPPL